MNEQTPDITTVVLTTNPFRYRTNLDRNRPYSLTELAALEDEAQDLDADHERNEADEEVPDNGLFNIPENLRVYMHYLQADTSVNEDDKAVELHYAEKNLKYMLLGYKPDYKLTIFPLLIPAEELVTETSITGEVAEQVKTSATQFFYPQNQTPAAVVIPGLRVVPRKVLMSDDDDDDNGLPF